MTTNENAALLAGVRGGDEHHKDTPLRMGNRPWPAPDVDCFALSGLLHPEGRARFRELDIGPEAFQDGEATMIATVLLAERDFTPEELEVIWRDDGRTLPWGGAVNTWTLDPVWAVEVVDRFAAERIRWWVPQWLNWIMQGIDEGQPLSWAVRELEWILTQLNRVAAGNRA